MRPRPRRRPATLFAAGSVAALLAVAACGGLPVREDVTVVRPVPPGTAQDSSGDPEAAGRAATGGFPGGVGPWVSRGRGRSGGLARAGTKLPRPRGRLAGRGRYHGLRTVQPESAPGSRCAGRSGGRRGGAAAPASRLRRGVPAGRGSRPAALRDHRRRRAVANPREPPGHPADPAGRGASYAPVVLEALTGDRTLLVPDPVLLPVNRTAVPAATMRYLLRGPTRWLAPAVTTALPAQVQLLGAATLDAGTVTVESVAAGRRCLRGRLGGLHQPGARHRRPRCPGDERQAAARPAEVSEHHLQIPRADELAPASSPVEVAPGGRPVRPDGRRDRGCGTGRTPRHRRAGLARAAAGNRSFRRGPRASPS